MNTNGTLQLSDGHLYYDVRGQGEPLLLMHAFTMNMEMWQPQLAAFSEHYQVIRFDFRGHGRSSAPQQAYRHFDDAKALLDMLKLSSVHVLGLSMGGGVAINFALAYPQHVCSLIVSDGNIPGYEHWSQEFNTTFANIYTAAKQEGVERALELWAQHPMFQPALANEQSRDLLRQLLADYSGWHFLNQDPAGNLTPVAMNRLAELSLPMLVMVGSDDLEEFHDMAKALAALPKSSFHELAGAGHMANLEVPQTFNQHVLDFLHQF